MEKISTLKDAFVVKLKSLYDVEDQLVEALPKLADAATHPDLKSAFQEHVAETQEHMSNLEKCFGILTIKPEKLKGDAIRGLISDSKWMLKEDLNKAVLDAMLIGTALYVEHYEMAGYTTAVSWASLLEYPEVADILSGVLADEEAAADKLAALAEEAINERALNMNSGM